MFWTNIIYQTGKLLGFSSSMISVARSAAPLVAGIAQEFSYAAPTYISLSISLIALYVFYHSVYLKPRPKQEPNLQEWSAV